MWGCEEAIVALSVALSSGGGVWGWSDTVYPLCFPGAVCLLAVEGCLLPGARLLVAPLSLASRLAVSAAAGESLGADVLLVVGDAGNPGHLDGLRAWRGLAGLYYVPGRLDDPFVVERAARVAAVVEGRVADAVGVRVAGVGGREPLMNIARLVSHEGRVDVLASYYPVHGVLDRSRLGVSSGLWELAELVEKLGVSVVASLNYEAGCLEQRGRLYAGLGAGRCVAVIEAGAGYGCRVRCYGREG